MTEATHAYRIPAGTAGPELFKDRKSKFIGLVFPVSDREAISLALDSVRSRYADANHVCYAYRLAPPEAEIRTHDDGEPVHSAGAPILGQIEAFGLHQVLVCVVRYFGGTKLGFGGLVRAYRECARGVLESCPVDTVRRQVQLEIEFGYDQLDAVMRIIDQSRLEVLHREMQLQGLIRLGLDPEIADTLRVRFKALPGVIVR